MISSCWNKKEKEIEEKEEEEEPGRRTFAMHFAKSINENEKIL